MNIYLGEKGLKQTWQEPFPKTIPCLACKADCRIVFVYADEGEVSRMHDNKPDKAYWWHDACAIAVYLCKKCFTVNGLENQA